MPLRLVALEEGPDILIADAMIVVGRSSTCDARLESICVSRRHCCLTPVRGELDVRDLGSTNGTRINGHRVVIGRLGPGDELAIAHLRYILATVSQRDLATMADSLNVKYAKRDGHGTAFTRSSVIRRSPAGG